MESVVNDNYAGDEKQSLKDTDKMSELEMSELDDSKAHFIKKDTDHGDVKIEVPSDKEFTGLTKQELMEYANKPFWTRLRLGLFILFWVAWIAMLAAAIIIIVLAPRCPYRPDHKWWQNEVVYQVYPKSFQDSSKMDKDDDSSPRYDDGVGDLQGFESRLKYLEDLNTNVIWMNSIFSEDKYGITNHTEVGEKYGTVAQLKKIVKNMHKSGMKMVLDFIPNHTSRNHTWFLKSIKKEGKYADYYIWAPCGNDTAKPPTNWKSVHGGSAWKRHAERGECYYHTYLDSQPDLNLRNEEVLSELKDILDYWLKLGVDGFHVCDAPYLVESKELKDELSNLDASGSEYNSLIHNRTMHLPETHALFANWSNLVSKYSRPGREKVLFTTMNADINTTIPYYGTNDKPGAHFIPSKALYTDGNTTVTYFTIKVNSVLDDIPENLTGGWQLGDANHMRIASAIEPADHLKAVLTLQMLLPGISINYYGNEIGLLNQDISFSDVVDPVGIQAGKDKYKSVYRDPFRTPMRWDNTESAGFTKGKPWLPIPSTPKQPTAESHAAKFAAESSLDMFKNLTKIRQEPSFRWGKTTWSVVDENILSFVRHAEGFPAFLVAINLGKATTVMFKDSPKDMFSDSMEVVVHSTVDVDPDNPETLNPLNTAVYINSGEAIVFKFMQKEKE